VSLYPQIFSKFWFKDSLAFFSKKGGKAAELAFLFSTNRVKDSKIVQNILF
jgi:hypothetical protein